MALAGLVVAQVAVTALEALEEVVVQEEVLQDLVVVQGEVPGHRV